MDYVFRTTDFAYGKLSCDEQVQLSKSQAFGVAGKRLGLCFLGALMCLPMPGVHFALVPGFLLAGFFLFFQAKNFTAKLVGVQTQCPKCQALAKYKVLYLKDEKSLYCKSCGAQLRILPKTLDVSSNLP